MATKIELTVALYNQITCIWRPLSVKRDWEERGLSTTWQHKWTKWLEHSHFAYVLSLWQMMMCS